MVSMTDTTEEDVQRVDCPMGCQLADLEHVHLQHADGCAQVWGVVNGRTQVLDPFDLQRTAVTIHPPRRRRGR